MSMRLPSRCPLYDTVNGGGRLSPAVTNSLLRVVLDDELLLDLGVDLRPARKLVHGDAHLVRHDLKPGRDDPLAELGPGDDHRGELERLGRHLDDVVLANAVRRDVDPAAVHHDVTVTDQLAGHVPALGEPGAEHDVVQPALEDLQQGLAGTAGLAGRLDVVAVELLLEHAVDATGLLLLADLEQVLAVLLADATVLARRVRPDLDRALGPVALGALQEQLYLFAAAQLAVRPCVSSHQSLLRRADAWAGGSHFAERGERPGWNRPQGRSPAATGSRSRGRSPVP